MKIGIACYPTHGGSGVVASELAIELAKRGHEIHVFSYALPFRLTGYFERIFYHEIQVDNYPLFKYPPFTLAAACKMIDVAETEGLDLLHTHYAVPWAVCAHLAQEVVAKDKGRQLKIVTTLHGTDITLVGQEPTFFQMTRFGIERSDGVTAVSQYLADETRKVFGIEKPIAVIHNSVDHERFTPKQTRCMKHLGTEQAKVLIHCSNFRPVKRVPDVVRMFAYVRREVNAILLMIGEGPELAVCRRLAAELGVDAHVRFLGNQDAVQDIFPCGDLFVLPSAYESFGLAALEAMACGVPVIATRIGGLSEVVTHGEDGFLCEVGDAPCMASHALRLLTDPDQQRAFGQEARRKAVEQFSPDQIIPRYEALYASVLNGGAL
jgi:N-acetyl-alpha-D-glucosaminyl L-malate synthase BshA